MSSRTRPRACSLPRVRSRRTDHLQCKKVRALAGAATVCVARGWVRVIASHVTSSCALRCTLQSSTVVGTLCCASWTRTRVRLNQVETQVETHTTGGAVARTDIADALMHRSPRVHRHRVREPERRVRLQRRNGRFQQVRRPQAPLCCCCCCMCSLAVTSSSVLTHGMHLVVATHRELQREQVAAEEALKAPTATKDYSLKQGEKIKIKINTTRKSRDTGDDGGDDSGFGASPSSGKASSSSGGTADLLGFSGSQYVSSLPLGLACNRAKRSIGRSLVRALTRVLSLSLTLDVYLCAMHRNQVVSVDEQLGDVLALRLTAQAKPNAYSTDALATKERVPPTAPFAQTGTRQQTHMHTDKPRPHTQTLASL